MVRYITLVCIKAPCVSEIVHLNIVYVWAWVCRAHQSIFVHIRASCTSKHLEPEHRAHQSILHLNIVHIKASCMYHAYPSIVHIWAWVYRAPEHRAYPSIVHIKASCIYDHRAYTTIVHIKASCTWTSCISKHLEPEHRGYMSMGLSCIYEHGSIVHIKASSCIYEHGSIVHLSIVYLSILHLSILHLSILHIRAPCKSKHLHIKASAHQSICTSKHRGKILVSDWSIQNSKKKKWLTLCFWKNFFYIKLKKN